MDYAGRTIFTLRAGSRCRSVSPPRLRNGTIVYSRSGTSRLCRWRRNHRSRRCSMDDSGLWPGPTKKCTDPSFQNKVVNLKWSSFNLPAKNKWIRPIIKVFVPAIFPRLNFPKIPVQCELLPVSLRKRPPKPSPPLIFGICAWRRESSGKSHKGRSYHIGICSFGQSSSWHRNNWKPAELHVLQRDPENFTLDSSRRF